MWADFEWENKVNVSTGITNLQEFVHHIAKSTNMRILTPIAALAGCNFLAANLYARSVFGAWRFSRVPCIAPGCRVWQPARHPPAS